MDKNLVKDDIVYKTLTSKNRTYEQKVLDLAHVAENSIDVLNIPKNTMHFFKTGAINDLFEGHAPYRPRYVMVDFPKFMKQGSKFLRLNPPKTLDEAIFSLMTLYHHIPSITNFPVYLGNLDYLLDPFIKDLSDDEVKEKIRLFFNYLDRTIDDSFCHANIGPKETRMGRLILEVEAILENTVPNLTIKYNKEETSDEFLKLAIKTSLLCSNPAICNDDLNKDYYPGGYGISSCYNILPICGGAYTLTRITLTKLAEEAIDKDDFLNRLLPECLKCISDYENERIKFLVLESGFFESSFLVDEGLIDKNRFVPMFGVTGLAEAVNTILKDKNLRYGKDIEADKFATEIMDKIKEIVDGFEAVYTPLTNSHFMLHAQVGLDSDLGITSGVRIPVGEEPSSFRNHLIHSAKYHKYFPAGVGDIFPISSHVKQNLDSLADIVKGAFFIGVHYMSFYSEDTDLVRITGYLVKKSEMDKYFKDMAVIHQTTALGALNYKANHLEKRKVRMEE